METGTIKSMRQVLNHLGFWEASFWLLSEELRKETKGLAELRRYNRFQEGKVERKSKAEFQE